MYRHLTCILHNGSEGLSYSLLRLPLHLARPVAVRYALTEMTNCINMRFSVGTSLLNAYETVNYRKQKMDGRRSLLQNDFYRKTKKSLMYASLQISHISQLGNSHNFPLVMGLYDIRYRKICTLLSIRESKLKK